MSTIAQTVSTLLAATPVTDLIGSRLHPMVAPNGETVPHLVYQIIDAEAINDLCGHTGEYVSRLQLKCWAATYGGAHALANVATDALADHVGDDTHFVLIGRQDMDVTVEPGKAMPRDYCVLLEFTVWAG